MSRPAGFTESAGGEFGTQIASVLGEYFGAERQVVELQRAPCPYQTSFAIEEIRALLDDGTSVDLIFKDLSPDALSREAREVKPLFLYDPVREIEAYRSILSRADLGTAICYGAIVDPERPRYWLFLENVPGVALWQIGDLAAWESAAGWLARMHAWFATRAESLAPAEHLLSYDARFYRTWLQRARAFAHEGTGAQSRQARQVIDWLAPRYDRVVERLTGLPLTLIHGEFYASNVIFAEDSGAARICPIDWEIAAVGPGLIDLAALTTGTWSKEEKATVALAYERALGQLSSPLPPHDDFLEGLLCCRLHLAVQWLGWAAKWSPPPEHRQDWLGEVVAVAEELEL